MTDDIKTTEELEEPTPSPEKEIPAEPVDNSDRSKLGRKVARMEEDMSEFMSRLEAKLEKFKGTGEPTYEEAGDDLVTASTLKTALENYFERKQKETQDKEENFRKAYARGVMKAGAELEETEFNSIIEELDKAGNPKTASDPELAAQINFLRVRNSLLEKRVSGKVNPLKGNQNKLPTSVGGETTNKNNEWTMPTLDPETMEFIRKSGLSEADVKDALTVPSATLRTKGI